METLIPAILVSAFGGMTFLAYKHPQLYLKILPAVGTCAVLFITALVSWNICSVETFSSLIPYIKDGQLNEASETLNSIHVPLWEFGVLAAFIVYLGFLLYLPKLIEKQSLKKSGQ